MAVERLAKESGAGPDGCKPRRSRYMRIKLSKWHLECLALHGRCSVCLPVTAATSTVLGYEVSSRNPMWRGLTWKFVMIDGADPFAPAGSRYQYLHVSHQEGKRDDGVRYRVRPRLENGSRVEIGTKRLVVEDVSVAGQWDDRWWWRISLGRVSVTK